MNETERKHRALAFVFIFIFVLSILLVCFQYLSIRDYKDELSSYREELKKLQSKYQELEEKHYAEIRQLEYYKQQARYYMDESQDYQGKLLGRFSGKKLGHEPIIRQMEVPTVGIEMHPHPHMVGMPLTLSLEIRSGKGSILVDTQPKTGIDLQGSARTACRVAEELTGFDLANKDVTISFRSPLPLDVVDGPSAGASMTILMSVAMEEALTRNDVMLTGTINQDGSIGQVGGIVEKADAALESGKKILLIPKGQINQIIFRRVNESVLGFNITVSKPVRVNLNEYCQKKGLEVIEVSDIEEALDYFLL